MVDDWGETDIRITGLSVTPDGKRLVAVGMDHAHPPPSSNGVDGTPGRTSQAGDASANLEPSSHGSSRGGHRLIVFDMETKAVFW